MSPWKHFFAPFGTIKIEIILPVGIPDFAGDLFVAYIELWTDLIHEYVKDSRVDIHKMWNELA